MSTDRRGEDGNITFINVSICSLTLSTVASLILLCLRSSSFCVTSSLRRRSSLKKVEELLIPGTWERTLPLPFRKLEAETVEHQLMWVPEDVRGACLWWGELLELCEGVEGDVLVDGAGKGEGKQCDRDGKNIRELATLVDLALEVAFLVEEVLEAEVCLVHVLPGICGGLLVGAGGDIGGPVEGL